jgi:hypothetical protein
MVWVFVFLSALSDPGDGGGWVKENLDYSFVMDEERQASL